MDNSHIVEEFTLESTPIVSNDSGYITTTPSTVCNDSPDNISGNVLSNRRPVTQYINETPHTSKKSSKGSSIRKHFLRQSSGKCELENIVEQVDSRLSYSSVPTKVHRHSSSHTEGNGSLVESFSHLLVDQAVCESRVNLPVHYDSCEENEVFHSNIGTTRLTSNSKKKASSSLGKVVVKKLKQDLCSVPLCGRFESFGSVSPRRCSYSGISRLDFLVHLAGVSGCFPGVISQILSYLYPQDLVTVCLVSSDWRRVCVDDPLANRRRLAYLRHVEQAKENITWDQFKQTDQSLNLSLASNKGVFREIQNTDRRDSNFSSPPSTPRSPPVSPSKVRFNLFLKAGNGLDEGTRLVRCPRCSHPSQVTSDCARCQAVGCQYKFCVLCLCDIHEGLPCPGRTILPVRRKTPRIGSKESRRNLRRL